MRCGLSHEDPLPLVYPDTEVFRCLRALSMEIPAAIGRERERIAALVQSAGDNPEGDYYGSDERWRTSVERTLQVLALRIRSGEEAEALPDDEDGP
jgi:hypothetical protein